jgi:bacterioferritin (cytochrome b1)
VPVTKDMLVSELQNLLRLTAFEQAIATVRRTQARTAAFEQELADNVKKAQERSALLGGAIRQAGGVPDVVGSAVGKLGALATAQLNQVQTLQGALLGDLTLEHQLRERTRYARQLAESLGETSLLPVFDRLELAHSATIDWLEQRLAEVGRTGTSMLRATPVQAAVATARRIAFGPLAAVTSTVNQASALLSRPPQPLQDALQAAATATANAAGTAVDTGVSAARTATQRTEDTAAAAGAAVSSAAAEVGERLSDTASSVAGAAHEAVDGATALAGDAVTTVEDAASSAAETVTETASSAAETVTETASSAAETVTETVTEAAQTDEPTVAEVAEQAKEEAAQLEEVDLTATGEVAHPFPGYEKLTGDRVMAHVRDTDDVAELEQLLAFETAHKARKGVLAAVRERLEALSADA